MNPVSGSPEPPISTPPPAPAQSWYGRAFSYVGTQVSWIGGRIAGEIANDVFIRGNGTRYLEKLQKKIKDPKTKTLIQHLAQECKMAVSALATTEFQKGIISATTVQDVDLFELLLSHALVGLKGENKNPDLLQAATEEILTSVISFAQKPNTILNESYQSYVQAESAKDVATQQKALKAIQDQVSPLVDELMRKAGLDVAGLDKILSFKQEVVSSLIKQWLVDKCASLYIQCAKLDSWTRTEEEAAKAIGSGELIEVIAKLMTKKTTDSLFSTYSNSSLSLAESCTKIFKGTITAEDQLVLAHSIQESLKPESTTSRIISSAIHAPLKTLITHGLYRIAMNSPVRQRPIPGKPDLLQIATEEILTSVISFALKPNPVLRASYQSYVNAKDMATKQAAFKSIQEQFSPLVDELMQKACLDVAGLGNILSFKKEVVSSWIKEWLVDKCASLYVQSAKLDSWTPAEEEAVEAMGARESVDVIAKLLTKKATDSLFSGCSNSSLSIAEGLSKALDGTITTKDQVVLAHSIQKCLNPESTTSKIISSAIQEPLQTLITHGLYRVAMNSPVKHGPILDRVEGYIQALCAELPSTDKRFMQEVRDWKHKKDELTQAKKTLEELSSSRTATEDVALIQKIEAQQTLVHTLSKSLEPQEKKLLTAFQPIARKFVSDMGYKTPSDLPLPQPFQEAAFTHITDVAAAELILEAYAKVAVVMYDATKETRQRSEHAENLHKRFGNYDLVNAARPFAQVLVKAVESSLAVDGKTLAERGVDRAKDMLDPETKKDVGALLADNRERLTDWAAQRAITGIEHIDSKFGKQIENETEAFLVHMLDNVTANIQKLEQEDPKRTFTFVLDLMTSLTQHLKTINETTKSQQKQHMYEVEPHEYLRQFHDQDQLDPAMTDYKLYVQIQNLERKITFLEKQIEENTGDIETVKLQLEDAKLSLTALQEQASQKANNNFYKPALAYFLAFANIRSPKDLPGPAETQEYLWNFLHSDAGAEAFSTIFVKALEPEKIDKYLRLMLETVNENMQAPDIQKKTYACTEEDSIMAKAAVEFLREVRRAMPGTFIGTLHKIDELQKLPASIVANTMRKTFKNYSLNKLVEYSVLKGSKEATAVLADKQAFPKNPSEAKKSLEQKQEANQRDIQEYHKQAGAAVYSGAEQIKLIAIREWDKLQKRLDQVVAKRFRKVGTATKQFLDPIMHVIFIDCIVRPLFSIFNLGMRVFYYAYSKQVIFHAEHLRRCVRNTPIHANYAYNAFRLFQRHYPM